MALDLSKHHAAAAAHTAEVQRLLDHNEKLAETAKQAVADEAASQAALDAMTQEFENQTAAIKAFNDASGAPAAK